MASTKQPEDERDGPIELDPAVAQRTGLATARLSATSVVHLQRLVGNRAVGELVSRERSASRDRPPHSFDNKTPIHRALVLSGQEIKEVGDAQQALADDFATMRKTIQKLIDLPGAAVQVNPAQLREVHLYQTNQQVPQSVAGKVATLQLLSHGTWTNLDTQRRKALPTINVWNTPAALENVGNLGKFLRYNANLGANLKAAGVGWDLWSTHPNIGGFGGAAVIDNRVHVHGSILGVEPEGFLRMVVHETGHATFQRLMLTGRDWTDADDKGEKPPEEKAMVEDGKKFYQAWQVLRKKPQYFYITDMPGNAAEAKGEGRRGYLAGKFSEFCAESFMHLAMYKDELQEHVESLPDEAGDVKDAWNNALEVLLKYESQILGKPEDAGEQAGQAQAALRNHRFTAALDKLKNDLAGPELEVKSREGADQNLKQLRVTWEALTIPERQQLRGEALSILEKYLMKVQRRIPAQAHWGEELKFANL